MATDTTLPATSSRTGSSTTATTLAFLTWVGFSVTSWIQRTRRTSISEENPRSSSPTAWEVWLQDRFMQQHWQQEGAFAGNPGGERVLRLITLGTPHHGSPMANGDARNQEAGPGLGTALWWFDNSWWSTIGPKFYELNRSNLHWDNYDDLLDYSTYANEETAGCSRTERRRSL